MKKIILSSLLTVAFSIGFTQAQSTVTFSLTGAPQSYTVPSNVAAIGVTVAGGQGYGGGGGAVYVQTIQVTAGQVLAVYVGGNGIGGSGSAGGYNGGGQAGSSYGNEGSGGGASDIRVSPYGLADRIIVAGGSGGRGGYSGGGGGAGGLAGQAGGAGQGGAGGGGTSNSGGAGGTGYSCGSGATGSLGIGGNGGVCSQIGGGGGGGGYYGGGGGGGDYDYCCADGGGGGGGSSYSSTSGGTCTTGAWSGSGRVTIKPLTGVSIIQTAQIACYGDQNAALSATVAGGTAPYTYSWSTGATSSTVSGLGAGTYTCWIVSSTAVTYSETFTVTQPNSVLTAYINNQYNVSCSGGQDGYLQVYVYNATYPVSYSWTPTGGNSYYAYNLSAGIYTCYVQDGSGCIVPATGTITQPPAPNIVAGASSSSVCAGGTVTLVGGGAYTYSWTNGVTDGVPFAPATSTTYVLTGTDYNGCAGYAQVSVQVVPSPTISVSIPPTTCAGVSATLTATGGDTYLWSNGNTTSTTVVSPGVSTNYVVAGTNSTGCTVNASVAVNIYPTPNLVATSSASAVCIGQSVTLNSSGANSYTWSPSITNGTAFQPSVSTIYTVSATDGYGCVSSKTSAVIVNPLPVLSVNGSTSICQGESAILNVIGANTYTWSTGSNSPSISISPMTTTVYSVTGANVNGCLRTSSVSLSVYTAPNVFISTNSTLVCHGALTTLQANGANSYTWYPLLSANPTVSVNPVANTSYTLIGNSNGCYSTSIISLSTIPVPTLMLSGPSTVCALVEATLTASGAVSYTWITGATTSSAVVSGSVTDYFTVAGTGTNGCVRVDSIQLNVIPGPPLNVTSSNSVICEGGSAVLTANSTSSYTWSTLQTSSSISVSPITSTTYSISGLGSSGCYSSAYFLITVSPCTKISEAEAKSFLNIYPNPSPGSFYVEGIQDIKLRMMNSVGQLVKNIELTGNDKQLILADELPAGIYFISGEIRGQIIHQKIIITK